MKAVFNPENEKLGFFELYIGFGKLKLLGSPSIAIFSIIGPPGNPMSSIFAALSKVSPAASSRVELNLTYFPYSNTAIICVCPPDTRSNKYGYFTLSVKRAVSACPSR